MTTQHDDHIRETLHHLKQAAIRANEALDVVHKAHLDLSAPDLHVLKQELIDAWVRPQDAHRGCAAAQEFVVQFMRNFGKAGAELDCLVHTIGQIENLFEEAVASRPRA